MKKASLLISLYAIFALNSVIFGSPQTTSPSEISSKEYEIYSVAIQDFFASRQSVNSIAITDYTVKDFGDLKTVWQKDIYFKQIFSPLAPETIDSYTIANNSEHTLKDNFDFKLNYIFLTKKKIETLFKRGTRMSEMQEWENVYKNFPGTSSIVSVSRVGFNSEQNQALVYLEFWCRSLCGEGSYILLNKQDGKWKTVKQHMMWVS